MLRTLMAALAAAALAACASPSGTLTGSRSEAHPGPPSEKLTTGDAVTFVNATPGQPLRVPGTIYRPSGAGPFPAMVLLHGCHGVSASTRDWGTWFRELGYVALVVDSWAPRAFPADCGPSEPELPSTERFDDAMGALAYLYSLPYVARGRVGVIGWSNGGVFAMSAVNGPSLDRARARGVVLPDPGFQAAVGVYPGGCFSLVQERASRPLLVLIGDADDWTLASVCSEMVAAMKARGADASIVFYPGAFHYFDVEGQPRTFLADVANRNKPNECCGATVAYDPTAFADSRRRVAEFLRRHLRAEAGR
jgi:dienelactone hydrolase